MSETTTEESTNPFDQLTPREKQVAIELSLGARNRDIAEKLDISTKTVDTHRGHLLTKLNCRHNVDLARLALKHGLVTL